MQPNLGAYDQTKTKGQVHLQKRNLNEPDSFSRSAHPTLSLTPFSKIKSLASCRPRKECYQRGI
jgi:hypothetical protein